MRQLVQWDTNEQSVEALDLTPEEIEVLKKSIDRG